MGERDYGFPNDDPDGLRGPRHEFGVYAAFTTILALLLWVMWRDPAWAGLGSWSPCAWAIVLSGGIAFVGMLVYCLAGSCRAGLKILCSDEPGVRLPIHVHPALKRWLSHKWDGRLATVQNVVWLFMCLCWAGLSTYAFFWGDLGEPRIYYSVVGVCVVIVFLAASLRSINSLRKAWIAGREARDGTAPDSRNQEAVVAAKRQEVGDARLMMCLHVALAGFLCQGPVMLVLYLHLWREEIGGHSGHIAVAAVGAVLCLLGAVERIRRASMYRRRLARLKDELRRSEELLHSLQSPSREEPDPDTDRQP